MNPLRLTNWLLRIDARKVLLFAALLLIFALIYTVGQTLEHEPEPPNRYWLETPTPAPRPASPWHEAPALAAIHNPFTSPLLRDWQEQAAAETPEEAVAEEVVEPPAPQAEPPVEEEPPPVHRVQLHYHGMLTRLDGDVRAFISAPTQGWQRAVRPGQLLKDAYEVTAIHPHQVELRREDQTYRLPRGETVTLEQP